MDLLKKTDEEIIKIANPIWDNLVKSSNIKDYGGFTRDFSSQMLFGANEVELGKQWANNKLLTSLSDKREVLGCLRRNLHITVIYKQETLDRTREAFNKASPEKKKIIFGYDSKTGKFDSSICDDGHPRTIRLYE